VEGEPKRSFRVEIASEDSRRALPVGQGGHLTGGGRAATLVVSSLADIDADLLVGSVSATINSLAEAFRPRAGGPASCEVKVGLKIGMEGHVILAKMGGEVNLEVKLTWDREDLGK
jgi:hypothetical protein